MADPSFFKRSGIQDNFGDRFGSRYPDIVQPKIRRSRIRIPELYTIKQKKPYAIKSILKSEQKKVNSKCIKMAFQIRYKKN